MGYANLNNFIDNPLAGCDENVKWGANYFNVVDSLSLRLAICYTRAKAAILTKLIGDQAEEIKIDQKGYVVNELLYEIRNGMYGSLKETTPEYESQLLQQWCKILLKKYPEDDVLDFVAQVTAFRKVRLLPLQQPS